jgi:organic radical activating enzyme
MDMVLFPKVPEVFKGGYPEGYRLGVDGWSFPKDKLSGCLPDGTRKLLTLDISLAPAGFVHAINEGHNNIEIRTNSLYNSICPHNCPGCFDRGSVRNKLLAPDEVKGLLEQAVELGLESVKFLGPGELLANPEMFEFLDFLRQKKIKIGIFTKGAIIGNDMLAIRYQGMTGENLAKALAGYDNVRMLVDGRSFDSDKANRMVPTREIDFASARNRAIELLAENGFNKDPSCQRMSLQTNPVTWENIDEIPGIFEWGLERNIPVCVTPTMVSGLGNTLLDETQKQEFQDRLISLYEVIYRLLLDKGVMTLEQLRSEGISSYAGTAPCNQLSCGMFIRKDGVVQRCPGNDREQFVIAEDVRRQPLREIWKNSVNHKLGPVFNNRCVKDGFSIPVRLYDEVLQKLESSA